MAVFAERAAVGHLKLKFREVAAWLELADMDLALPGWPLGDPVPGCLWEGMLSKGCCRQLSVNPERPGSAHFPQGRIWGASGQRPVYYPDTLKWKADPQTHARVWGSMLPLKRKQPVWFSCHWFSRICGN